MGGTGEQLNEVKIYLREVRCSFTDGRRKMLDGIQLVFN